MADAEDKEVQHRFGMPVEPGQKWARVGDTEPRVAGIPRSWISPAVGKIDTRRIRHPMRWMRWRLQVRRLGPEAPDYPESESKPPRDGANDAKNAPDRHKTS